MQVISAKVFQPIKEIGHLLAVKLLNAGQTFRGTEKRALLPQKQLRAFLCPAIPKAGESRLRLRDDVLVIIALLRCRHFLTYEGKGYYYALAGEVGTPIPHLVHR